MFPPKPPLASAWTLLLIATVVAAVVDVVVNAAVVVADGEDAPWNLDSSSRRTDSRAVGVPTWAGERMPSLCQRARACCSLYLVVVVGCCCFCCL